MDSRTEGKATEIYEIYKGVHDLIKLIKKFMT